MSIHDTMTAAIDTTRRQRKNRSSARLAGAAWEALHKAGYRINLPDGPTTRDPQQKLNAIRQLCEATASRTDDGVWYVDVEDLYAVLDDLT